MRLKKAFTLLELLVVVGIMGFLGTVSIAGYRGITLGMEERGAVENASQVIRSARERALVDRRVVAIKYWNETVSVDPDDENALIVVGKAVAVRSAGRLTRVKNGKYLCDEFADLEKTYPAIRKVKSASGDESEAAKGENQKVTENNSGDMYLYQMKNLQSGIGRSLVSDYVFCNEQTAIQEDYLSGEPTDDDKGYIYPYAFYVKKLGDAEEWKAGDAYGFSFAEVELPRGYFFGSQISRSLSDPVTGEGTIVFDRNGDVISGAKTLQVCALRPGKTGGLEPTPVGTTPDLTQKLEN